MASRTSGSAGMALAVGGLLVVTYAIQRWRHERGVARSRAITIGKPYDQVERAWHDATIRQAVFAATPQLAEHVTFRCRPATPASWGTEVTLSADPTGTGTALASAIPSLTNPVLLNLLHRFKAFVEAGEIPTLAKTPAGRNRIITAA